MKNNELLLSNLTEGRTNPRFTSASAIRSLAHKQPEPIIEGLIRLGEQLMVYSTPGAGKSWFALAIAIASATGGPVSVDENARAKWPATKARKVLLVDGELDGADLAQRLKLLDPNDLLKERDCLTILSRQQQEFTADFPNLGSPHHAEDLLKYCIQEGVELLVLDNLTTLAQLEDENNATAFNPLIQGLLMRLKTAGIGCVLVHHSNKGDGGYRGSSALATTFNAIIHLKPEPLHRGAFTLHFMKSRNRHIDNKSVRMELKEQPDGSLKLICDDTVSKLELIAHLVRSREYMKDQEVMAALAIALGESSYNKGTFSKWKKQCIAAQIITCKEWDQCLQEASELSGGQLML